MIIRQKSSIKEIKEKASQVSSEQDLDELKNLINSDHVQDILCNQCGESCRKGLNFEGLIEVVISGGTESTVAGDEKSLRFSICEKCLPAIINNFKIQPAKRDDSSEFSDFIETKVSHNNTTKLQVIKK